MKILVVDDSAIMRKVIEKTINFSGLQKVSLFEASNGEEGLAILDEHDLDLVFIDINMPVMDGMKMLQEVRKRSKTEDLPVLIVSAESNKSRIDEVERFGAVFIHKPFTPEKLKGKMLGILNQMEV